MLQPGKYQKCQLVLLTLHTGKHLYAESAMAKAKVTSPRPRGWGGGVFCSALQHKEDEQMFAE